MGARNEMQALKKMALSIFQDRMQAVTHERKRQPSNFLRLSDTQQFHSGLPEMTNVRVGASREAFPTIADLVEDMEQRRDAAESQGKSMIIETELKLLQQELNAMMGKELT